MVMKIRLLEPTIPRNSGSSSRLRLGFVALRKKIKSREFNHNQNDRFTRGCTEPLEPKSVIQSYHCHLDDFLVLLKQQLTIFQDIDDSLSFFVNFFRHTSCGSSHDFHADFTKQKYRLEWTKVQSQLMSILEDTPIFTRHATMSAYKSVEVNLLSSLKKNLVSDVSELLLLISKLKVPNWDLGSTLQDDISRFEFLYFSLISSHQYLRFKIRQLAMLRYKISVSIYTAPRKLNTRQRDTPICNSYECDHLHLKSHTKARTSFSNKTEVCRVDPSDQPSDAMLTSMKE